IFFLNFSFYPVLNFIKNDVSKDERFLKHKPYLISSFIAN
ncbi:hypothetical protein M136_3609, partial [Bacteroides fragilis str. S36L11]